MYRSGSRPECAQRTKEKGNAGKQSAHDTLFYLITSAPRRGHGFESVVVSMHTVSL